ncbi:AI-2E family transporter [Thermococcus sp. Bubb.Bath]|uniref:AI-2E family transporter n=1 Tax=Thermococcus sp. Bubb.Bath TaxID=1638242 RepID=UPI00143BE67F|nr:AI-2E family transporter [Thermococcus sp. Bubb.Bath]NJF24688.1 AI-2E family transporter [Thermococcus sp. Bubb.Bath]
MRSETIVWIVISAVIFYLIWLVIEPVLSPIIIALTIVYVTYPAHVRLEKRVGAKKSAFILTILLSIISFLFIIGFVLWISEVKYQLVGYLESFFNWLQSVTVSSQTLNEVLAATSQGVSTRLEKYIISYTYSLPKLSLEVFIMIFVYYGALLNVQEIVEEVYSLIPTTNREFGLRLIDATRNTLDTLLKSWLSLSVIKGSTAALGFWVFGVSQPSGAIALGILVAVLELLPLLGGWMVWLPMAFYLGRSSGILMAILFSLYSAVAVSPAPDILLVPRMTIKKRGLNAFISLVGIFGGLWAFGLVGIIIGPVALGLLTTVAEEWKNMVKEV